MQACGTSLVETVNHVLDFTKLSGNSKSGGVEHAIAASRYVTLGIATPAELMAVSLGIYSVDLMQLVEEAVDGCWVGHRARTANLGDSGIGSVYSPPKEDSGDSIVLKRRYVETVIDIGYKKEVSGHFLILYVALQFFLVCVVGLEIKMRERRYSARLDELVWKQFEVHDGESISARSRLHT